MNVLVAGDKGVGKTSLIKRYIENRFDFHDALNDSNYKGIINRQQLGDGSVVDIQIFEKYTNIDTDFEKIVNADTILLCYNKTYKNTFQHCIDIKEEIMQYTKTNVIILLVACKSDQGYNNREIEETKSQHIVDDFKWKSKVNVFSLECSAKTGINVKSIFSLAAERYAHNIDLSKQDIIFNELIDIALNYNKDIEWTRCRLQDPDIRVEYGASGDKDVVYTVRSWIKSPVYVSCDEFYEFLDAQKENIIRVKRKDSTIIGIRCVKIFDSDRCLVYSAYNSSAPGIISARDFCYLQIRKRFTNYKNKNKYIVAVVGYSVDDTFDGYIPKKKDRVRGHLYLTGYVFEKINKYQSRAYYVVKLDPCGTVPKWIVNLNAAAKGYDIKWIREKLLDIIKRKDSE